MTKKKPKNKLPQLKTHKLDWLEFTAIGFALWFLIYPKPYTFLFTVLLIIPVAGIVLNGFQKSNFASLVSFGKDVDGTDDIDVADFITMPAWVILMRVLIDFEFESFYSLLIPGTIAAIIIVGLLFATNNFIGSSNQNNLLIYTFVIFNVCLYSYAGTYGANCVYDNSKPEVYHAKVIDKHIYSGSRGRKTYNLKVSPWGNINDPEDISVASSQYKQISIGGTIAIDLKQGLFHIPWYYVE